MENATTSSTNSPTTTTTPPQPEQQPYTKFDAGDSVILHSLIQSTHVNGRRGIIHHYPKVSTADVQNPLVNDPNPNEPRCMVQLLPETNPNNSSTSSNPSSAATDTNSTDNNNPDDNNDNNSPLFNIAQQCISIKTKNMTLDYPPGQDVKLFGLVGAKHYNDRVARIVSYRVVKKNGKREPRYLVEIPIHSDDYKKDDGVIDSSVKQILVSPKNIIHLPGQKPPPVPVLDQRLIFTGSMKSIIKVLNQSVHKIPTPNDIFQMRGFNLLSDEDQSFEALGGLGAQMGVPEEEQMALEQRGIEMALMAKQWGKIQMRSYKCRVEDATTEGEEEDDITTEEGEDEGNNHLPPSYQRLQSTCPSMGRTLKLCFNPKCYKVITNPTSKQSKMKRCTKCNAVAYCNRECAIEAWDYHRKVCKVIQNDNVRFADYVTLSSPQRTEVMATQRMVRLCVNRIASLDDSDGHFQSNTAAADDNDNEEELAVLSHRNNNNTAKLLYDVMTQVGPDITNKILMMVENPPPVNREVTVAVAFNSLGADPIYSNKDIQLFANVHDCSVTYQQQQVTKKSEEDEEVEAEDEKKVTAYSDIVTLEPNGEPLPGGVNIMGNVPDDVQEGFFNFMNGLVPGGMNAADDVNNGGGGGGGGPGPQIFMPQMAGVPLAGGIMDANGVMGMMGGAAGGGGMMGMMGGAAGGGGAAQQFIPAPPGGMPPPGMMMGNVNANGAGQFFMPGQGPPANANNNGAPLGDDDDIPEMGEEVPLNNGGDDAQADAQADANPINDDNDNAAANGNGAAAGGVQNVPPALANFLQHVLQETGVMPNAGGNNNNNNEDNGDDANDDDDEDDNLPQVEDVADNNPNQQPQPQPQPNQGNFQFGGAHVHVAQVNANDAVNGAPPMPPPGAFFQVPGMPVGVQVAVAQAGLDIDGADGEGMGGMPPQMAGLQWMGGGQGDEMNGNQDEEPHEESDMEIED